MEKQFWIKKLRKNEQGQQEDLMFVFEQENQCKHEKTEIQKITASNRSIQFKQVCLSCGAKVSNAIKHDLLSEEEKRTAKEYDPEMYERNREESWNQRKEKREQLRKSQREEWFSTYSKYLLTDVWQGKRELVFQRANGVCEGCMQNKASQIHHLTYQNVGDELLFELVALCAACHEKIHSESEND